MNLEEIKKQAELELAEEEFKIEVNKYKQKLKNKKTIWDFLFPYKIIIIKKGKGERE